MGVIRIIVGAFVLIIGLGIFIGGSAVLLVIPIFQDDQGFIMSNPIPFEENEAYAVVIRMPMDMEISPEEGVPFPMDIDPSKFVDFKINAQGYTIGIALTTQVDAYLANVTYFELDPSWAYAFNLGDDDIEEPLPPVRRTNTTSTSTTGPSWVAIGTDSLTWADWEFGDYTAVIMNTDHSEGMSVSVRLGAKVPILNGIGWGLTIFGGLFLMLGSILIYTGARTKDKTARPRYRVYQAKESAVIFDKAGTTESITCSNCGVTNPPDSSFCSRCGEPLLIATKVKPDVLEPLAPSPYLEQPTTAEEFVVVGGGPRFWAWLIDIVIVGIITESILGVLLLTLGFSRFGGAFDPFSWAGLIAPNGIFLAIYWTVMEYYYGQSIGKMALDVEIVDERTGKRPELIDIVVSAVGKAFFLPFDVIIGLIVKDKAQVPDMQQRLAQKISKTVVVRKRPDVEVRETRFVSDTF